ncbi:two-component sensor histidine kinase, partial [Streptomyces sp. SID8455]|nr:two-component sensor histidine kinase [Streptomyces sp. SID8455]
MTTTPDPPVAPPKPTWEPKQQEPLYPWLRPTIRIRLTLLYGGMFLIAGILLLSIIYMLAAQALHVGSELPFEIVSGKVTSEICDLPTNASPDAFNAAMNACVNNQRKAALDTLLNRSLLALV